MQVAVEALELCVYVEQSAHQGEQRWQALLQRLVNEIVAFVNELWAFG